MTPAARVQAAIEILDSIIAAARSGGAPADRILADWFRPRRFAGSGDRRAVRELVFRVIRSCGDIPENGRAAMLLVAHGDSALAVLFDGSRHGPEPIAPDEPVAHGGLAPAWIEAELAASGITGSEAIALLERAPLDIRVNALKAACDMIVLPAPAEPIVSRFGLRLPAGTPVEQWQAFRDGLFEVQDAGSQLACDVVAAQPGETVIDLCAGAGGKALALAACMDNRGRIIASDTDRGRLSRLMPRAGRAGAVIIETVLLDPGRELDRLEAWRGKADAVLVDAPCSGTGTWRRNPEARWRIDKRQLARLAELQSRLLDIAALLVRPGGRLIYVTCSLLDAEGRHQVDGFLARHRDWSPDMPNLPAGREHGKGIRLTPFHDGTDGFFIAGFACPC